MDSQRVVAKQLGLSDEFLTMITKGIPKRSGVEYFLDYDYIRKKRKAAKASRRRNRKK